MSIEKTVNDLTTTNWYTKFTKYGTATSEPYTGADPDVQLRLVDGQAGSGGDITYTGFQINPDLKSFEFNMEVYWSPTVSTGGDYYRITFGSATSSLSILFHFWSGYNVAEPPNPLYGTGIYVLDSSNAPIIKSTLQPGPAGPGSDQWFPVTVTYNKSAANTWTVTSNGSTVLTYADPNVDTWQQVEGNCGVSVHAHSGGGLRMRTWVRRLVLTYKAMFPVLTANTSLMPKKFYPSSDDSTFSGNRAAYTRVLYPQITSAGGAGSAAEITKRNLVYGRHDAASRVERLKSQAIGKSSMRLKEIDELSFKAPNVNDVRHALKRSRSKGYVVHPRALPNSPAPAPAPAAPAPAPAPAGTDLIVYSLTTSLSAYEESSGGDWVSITAAEWATLKTNVSGTVTAGASDTMMTTNTNLGSGLTQNPVSAIVTNLVELPRSSKVAANSYIYGFSVRFGSDLGTSFGVFANTSTSSKTGFNQLGNLISSMINGTNYFVLKGVSATNGSTDGLLGFFTGTKLDYEGVSFKGSAARIRFIGDNNTGNPLIRWNFFTDATIPDSSTVLEGSLDNYGTFCIQALTTPTKQWD
jgi:hypothetical protein